jgi:molybdopterin synthase catalytic subunit
LTCVITNRPLSIAAVNRHLDDDASGAVVVFVGRVRPDTSKGRRVVALDYEADRKMALDQLRALETRSRREFGARRVFVIHRVGRLRVGTASVIVGVTAPHRDAAFRAARFLIEELKREVPIWKSDRWARAPTGRRRRTPHRRRNGRSPG